VKHAEADAWIAEAVQQRPGLVGIEIHPGYDGLVIEGIVVLKNHMPIFVRPNDKSGFDWRVTRGALRDSLAVYGT
jgi:hypothetical protein